MALFRRNIQIVTRCRGNAGEARAALEDDFHHFRVEVRHRDGAVTLVTGAGLRHPYSTCPRAAGQLSALEGLPLDRGGPSAGGLVDPGEQCTHMLDLAGLATAAAARGTRQRRYDIEIPRHVEGRTTARLSRDGVSLLEWHVDDLTILGPAPYIGVGLGKGMSRWVHQTLSADECEAALVLRRCAIISRGRLRNLDEETYARPTGRCFVQQPHRAPEAIRQIGSTEDFTRRSDALCSGDRAWLAFAD